MNMQIVIKRTAERIHFCLFSLYTIKLNSSGLKQCFHNKRQKGHIEKGRRGRDTPHLAPHLNWEKPPKYRTLPQKVKGLYPTSGTLTLGAGIGDKLPKPLVLKINRD